MKKIILKYNLILFFILSFIIPTIAISKASVSEYSMLIDEDWSSVMFIYRNMDNDETGEIITYGGYKWFEETYNHSSHTTTSFIQPADIGIDGDMYSWMKERYQLQRFNYSFNYIGSDQVINFVSPEAIQVISGYITRSEPFSISTLSSTTWYSGTYDPIKTIDDLKVVAKNNTRTFCNILSNPIVINSKNTELKINNLPQFMKTYGFECDQNLNLI